jgi:probable UDP-sugar transporter A4
MHLVKKAGWSILLLIQVISYGSYSVLVHLCEKDGKITFNSVSLNLLIEFFKLSFSISAYALKLALFDKKNDETKSSYKYGLLDESLRARQIKFSLRNSLNFSIPAILYFINNNLAVYIQLFMDSTSYQMLSNLKIFTTAILYYLIIGKKLSHLKLFSLIVLFLSGVLYSLGNLNTMHTLEIKNHKEYQAIMMDRNYRLEKKEVLIQSLEFFENFKISKDQIYITEFGFLLILVYCVLSGLSGVYNEYLFKLNFNDSIFIQNIYLYFYGCLLNLSAYLIHFTFLIENKTSLSSPFGEFFTGFNVYVWIIILTQVFNGLLMSIVMKHSNNITRLFVISSSLVVTTILSVLFFSLKLNVYFYFCFVGIMIALYLYIFD